MSMNWFLLRMPPAQMKALKPLVGLDADEPEWWTSQAFLDIESRFPQIALGQSWHTLHFLLTGTFWGGADLPLGHAILGKTPLGKINEARLGEGEVAYGNPEADEAEILPCGLVGAKEVQTIADALSALSPDAVRARYDPAAFQAARLYPWGEANEWLEQGGDLCFDFADAALREHIMARFGELIDFYQSAARAGEAVFQYPMGMM